MGVGLVTSIQAASERGNPVDLRELEKEANEGPWAANPAVSYWTGKQSRTSRATVDGATGQPLFRAFQGARFVDVELIAALRNAAPFLLDVVEAARGYLAVEYPTGTGHPADQYAAVITDALEALDSHLSAASERETPG